MSPSFRPQYAFPPPPEGYKDSDFVVYFDKNNTPALGQALYPGTTKLQVPLQFQRDAACIVKAIKVGLQPDNPAGLILYDAFENPLSSDFVPASVYGTNPSQSSPGSTPIPFEPDLPQTVGATWKISLKNLAGNYTPSLEGDSALNAGNGSYSGQSDGSFPWQGRYYSFVQDSSNNLHALVSYDGATFTESDSAHDLLAISGGGRYWDGVSNLIVIAYNTAADGSGTNTLTTFDMNTGLWGTPFATGGATTAEPTWVSRRPDGSYIVVFSATAGNTPQADIWNGAAWVGAIDLTTNVGASGGTSFTATVDATGLTHVLFGSGGTSYYQQVTAVNALGNFHTFTGLANTGNNPAGAIQIVQDQLVWGVYSLDGAEPVPAIFVGAPLANPVWTISGQIDPLPTSAGNDYSGVGSYPSITYDASGILYAVWIRRGLGGTPSQVVLATNINPANPLTGWNTQVMWDFLVNPGPFGTLFYPILTLQNVNTKTPGTRTGSIVGFALDITSGSEQRYFAGQALDGIALTFYCQKRREQGLNKTCGHAPRFNPSRSMLGQGVL